MCALYFLANVCCVSYLTMDTSGASSITKGSSKSINRSYTLHPLILLTSIELEEEIEYVLLFITSLSIYMLIMRTIFTITRHDYTVEINITKISK